MKNTLIAACSVGVVQGVAEMPLPDVLKSVVSIVVGIGYILDLVVKLRNRRKAKNYYKRNNTK